MQRVDAKDRALLEATSITSLKFAILDIIIRAFLKELFNLNIRRETIKDLAFINKSLREVYTLAEKSRFIKLEISKLVTKDFRS